MMLKNFENHPNFYLNLTQAAKVLGYKDYRKVEELVNNGFLSGYRMPHMERIKVKYHEVMRVPTLEITK